MLLDDRQAGPDAPIAIRLLGAVDVTRGGCRLPDLTPALAEVLALIALCGPDGISASELVDLVASGYEKIKTSALQRRISDLRNKCGIQFQDFRSSRNRYILQLELVESIDSEDFIQGVAGLSPTRRSPSWTR